MTDPAKAAPMLYPMFVVFDLDGTLADGKHREHFINREIGAKDWRGYFAACDRDQAIGPIVNTLRALAAAGHDIEIWTGRSDEVAEKTAAWLQERGLHGFKMRSRPAGDHTPDHELKAAWMEQASRKPSLVFEDRARVVAMWRSHGIVCCQVAPGDF